ncbi:LamG domain-containing protein [Streptomyces subrutilus]|nr:LamG domain-containing protein [Streptomyces subrutilus]
MALQDSLLKVYGDRSYTHVTMARHQGTTVAFAMDSSRRIVYSVLDLAGDQAKGATDAAFWGVNPVELAFPRELSEVGFGVVGPTAMPVVKRGGVEAAADEQPTADETDTRLSTTARLTASAPFHVISDGTYVVVLRQSTGDAHPDAVYKLTNGGCSGNPARSDYVLDGAKKVPLVRDTLLCDRFVLVEGKLKPVLEVRYRRSRHATRAESAKDTLGTEDMEGRPFYEPTQELSFIRNLSQGRFAAVLVPTAVNNVQRWQFFAHNDATGRVDCFNVEQGVQGLFNTRGTRFYTSPDPVYRDAVFERDPGTCPFTKRELVPVTGSDGHAETALRLAGNDAHVELGDVEALRFAGKPYSIEAWVKPEGVDGPVLARGGACQLALNPDGTVYLAHDAAPYLISSAEKIAKDTYSHIAGTFDGKTVRVYVNGKLSGSGDMPFVDDPGALTLIGKKVYRGRTIGYFKGDIDEVRVWNRARSAAEIAAEMNHRLIGSEPGLVAYYRFDEGTGTTAFDQTDRALRGALKGDARWVGSDAPVGDHPGVRRDSFTLTGRTVVSGMSAVLYHQQEKAPAGYGGAAKPVKRQARVMLAFAAKDGPEACVASVDFGVGRDGRLAQVPDVLDPTLLKRPVKGENAEQISALQQLIKRLEPEIAALRPEIARLRPLSARLPEFQTAYDQLNHEVSTYQKGYDAEKDLVTSWFYDIFPKLQDQGPSGTSARKLLVAGSSSSPAAVQSAFVDSPTVGVWSFDTVQVGAETFYNLAYKLFNQDMVVRGGSRDENADLTTLPRMSTYAPSNFSLLTEGDYVRLVNRQSKLAVSVVESARYKVVQTSAGLRDDSGLLRMVRGAMRSGVDVLLQTAKDKAAKAADELATARSADQKVRELERSLAAKEAELKAAQEKLARLSVGFEGDADLTVAMPSLGVDRTGLSYSGGLLDFARGADRPALLDSGTGNIVLYFRGANGQFFAAYYDTTVIRGVQELPTSGGTVSFVARDAGIALEGYTIKVSDGDAPGRCDLTITANNDSETWRSLPREAGPMNAALAGNAGAPVTVGTVSQVTGTTVQLTEGAAVKVPAAAHLSIGGSGYAAADEIPLGGKTITLSTSGTAIKPGDKISVIGYDHARATSSQPGVLLSSGSRLVALAAGAVHSVPNGTARPTITGSGCLWRAEMPGRAYLFNGKDQYLSLPADKLDGAATTGDLSLEAWVNPETGQARLVHANTAESAYSLALTPADLPTQSFDGDDRTDLNGALDLSHRDFTIELWARRSHARSRLEPLLTHGNPAGATDQTLHLHIAADNTLTFALYGDDLKTTQPYPDLDWHHYAAVYVNATREQILYRDGTEVARRTANGPYTGNGPLVIGAQPFNGQYLHGQIDEVRVFGRVRTPEEISGERHQRMSGREPGLLGHWTFTGTGATPSPIKGYQVVARVGDRVVRSAERFACNEWAHLAATFTQAWAVRQRGTIGLEVAPHTALDVLDDLTIEVFLQLDRLGTPMGLIAKGEAVDGGPGGVPYQVGIRTDGRVEFAFCEAEGKAVRYTSDTALRAGAFHRVSVVRQTLPPEAANGAQSAQEIRFYLDGRLDGSHRYAGPGAQSNRSAVELGRRLHGALGEVRLWNTARKSDQLGLAVTERAKGLVARWSFEENTGNITYDAAGAYPARLRGARWTRDPDPKASALRLYRNGQALSADPGQLPRDSSSYGDKQFTLGAALYTGQPVAPLAGTLEEVRVWRTVRTPEQISDHMFTRVRGGKQDLLGYWPFDRESTTAGAPLVRDEGLRGHHLAFTAGRPRILLSTAPVSTDTAEVRSALAAVRTPFHDTIAAAPAVTEYADLQFGPKGEATGALKRCYGYLRDGRWHLLTGYKVGDLTTEWVGQVQFDPELMGYIEGAPPVPSENLTNKDDGYRDASSVEFTEADQVTYGLSSSKDASVTAAFKAALAMELSSSTLTIAAPLGVGIATPLAEGSVKTVTSLSLEFSNTWSSETKVSQGQNTTRKARVALTGHVEDPARVLNSAIGRRYVPANTGMALVQSQTADVFALRLAHTGALVAYRMLPNPDTPRDWNIIHFPINPRYVKQGTLDGAVGFDDRGKVTDPDYPTAVGYGEYSYFKPRDAYALKRRIARDQQRMRAFYESVSTETHRHDPTHDQADKVLRSMGITGGRADDRRGSAGSAASAGFSHRDLVNTYVWTAHGGFFEEATEATDAVTETTSGSYSFTGTIGQSVELVGSLAGVGITGSFDASIGGSMSTTRARTKDSSRTFGLNVQCAPSGDLQRRDKDGKPALDAAGKPVLVPGKVDAYRFSTFYLGETSANFDDFYHKVIDPLWLANSDAPDAAALRQARQSSAKPPCWRILHRVTFLSRVLPAVPPPGAPPLDKAMRAENIDSNYELIRRLEPYVRTATKSASELAAATRSALTAHLPELVPHAADIIDYLAQYYSVEI